MESINKNSSSKMSAIELLGKNVTEEIERKLPHKNLKCVTNVKLTPEFQLPLPKTLLGPAILSGNYNEAMDQLRYLIEANLIIPDTDTTYLWKTNGDPADEWIYDEQNKRHYKDHFDDWVWAEDDCRESRKEDIFRLRRLFREDGDDDEDDKETEEIYDRRNQREGDTSVYWLLDYSRHIYDVTMNLHYNILITYRYRTRRDVVMIPTPDESNIMERTVRTMRRHGF